MPIKTFIENSARLIKSFKVHTFSEYMNFNKYINCYFITKSIRLKLELFIK